MLKVISQSVHKFNSPALKRIFCIKWFRFTLVLHLLAFF